MKIITRDAPIVHEHDALCDADLTIVTLDNGTKVTLFGHGQIVRVRKSIVVALAKGERIHEEEKEARGIPDCAVETKTRVSFLKGMFEHRFTWWETTITEEGP